MPLLGWLAGSQVAQWVQKWEHWLAFVLLGYVGGKMIWESFGSEDCSPKSCVEYPDLFVMSIATSLDALAVGITLGVLKMFIVMPALVIGLITFVVCFGGVYMGHRLQSVTPAMKEKRIEWIGGVVLIGIGAKILIDHLVKGM